jgi:hypothetical protein
MTESRSYARARVAVAPGDSTSSLRERATATRRLSRVEVERRLPGAPAFPHPRCDGSVLEGQVRGYEQATRDPVRTPKKRNLVAACYRVHGEDFLPLVQEWFSRTGTATNLLFDIRMMAPRATPPEPVVGTAQRPPTTSVATPERGARPIEFVARVVSVVSEAPEETVSATSGAYQTGSAPQGGAFVEATGGETERRPPSIGESSAAERASARLSRPPVCRNPGHESAWVERPDGTWRCATCHP